MSLSWIRGGGPIQVKADGVYLDSAVKKPEWMSEKFYNDLCLVVKTTGGDGKVNIADIQPWQLNDSGIDTQGAIDIAVRFGKDWAVMWDYARADLYDVMLTGRDGKKLNDFSIQSLELLGASSRLIKAMFRIGITKVSDLFECDNNGINQKLFCLCRISAFTVNKFCRDLAPFISKEQAGILYATANEYTERKFSRTI